MYYNAKSKAYKPIEFYNLTVDVAETNNQVKAKENQNIIKQMLTKLEKGLTFKEPVNWLKYFKGVQKHYSYYLKKIN